jgi:hypothetical protein
MRSTPILAVLLFLFASTLTSAQSLPDKIRGYKVYRAPIEISDSRATLKNRKSDATVRLLDPRIVDIGPFGASIDIGAEIIASEQSGQVDMVSFRDVRINDLKVEVEDYNQSFSFKEGQPVTLPKPARISIRIANIARAAYAELTDKPDELALTGTAFVFGRFRKFGLIFKRVVPVKIDLKIKNLLFTSFH